MTRRTGLAAALLLPLSGCMSDEPIQQPTPLFETAPFEFPVELWDRGVEGETVLMIHITPLGAVDSAYVWQSSGHPQFDSAALAGASQLRFTPGRRGDRRVNVWAKLPVRFSKEGAAAGGLRVPPPDGERRQPTESAAGGPKAEAGS